MGDALVDLKLVSLGGGGECDSFPVRDPSYEQFVRAGRLHVGKILFREKLPAVLP